MRRLAEETGHDLADIARAYTVARDSFSLREMWIGIETLDNQVPAHVQSAMLNETILLIERVTVWMLHHRQHPMAIAETTRAFRPQVMALKDNLPDLVSERRRESIGRAYRRFCEEGVPDDIAAPVANLRTLASACDVIETANVMEIDVIDAATVFFEVGETFGADWMRDALARLPVDNRWDRLAQQALVEDSYLKQRRISLAVLATGEPAPAATARWIRDNQARVARSNAIMNDLKGRRFSRQLRHGLGRRPGARLSRGMSPAFLLVSRYEDADAWRQELLALAPGIDFRVWPEWRRSG